MNFFKGLISDRESCTILSEMYIAIDIGGTKTAVAAYDENAHQLRIDKYPTNPNFQAFLKQLDEKISEIAGDDRVDAIAIGAPATIDFDTGIAKRFGNLGWENVDIVGPLKERFLNHVYIDNDANMGALGEANLGAGTGYEKMLYVTLSTGIGTGVTVNGKISPALRESEGGMMMLRNHGKLEEWEDFASGRAFVEEFGLFGKDDDNPNDWKAWAEDVSVGLVSLLAIIQPDAVVIGGSMGNFIEKYHSFLHEAVERNRGTTVDMPIILGAKDPDNAVLNGCYVVCKQQLEA